MRKKKKRNAKSTVNALVTVFVFGVIITIAAIAAPRIVSSYRRSEAAAALEQERFDRAIELLLPELDRDPKNTSLRMELVDYYIEIKNYSRAEYLLAQGMREVGSQPELYRKMCSVYVMQDKLYDAVNMLNGLSNPFVKQTLESERPDPPVFDPLPGNYRESLTVSLTYGTEDACFVSPNGGIPSTEQPYEEPLSMPQGITAVRAVTVSPDGMVSDWAAGSYKLDDVIEPVIFEDPEIERFARSVLEMPTGVIISDKLQTITSIEIPEAQNYTTLADLRYFTHLQTLSLTGMGSMIDISSLAGLDELTVVRLDNFGIDSFSLETIGQMTWLTDLDLTNNHIVSLESLRKLAGLQSLVLNSNNILDLTPLERLTSIKILKLNQNAIEDTLPLLQLTALEILEISENRLRDLRGLAGMKSLTILNLSKNSIFSLDYLKSLNALTTLNLSSNSELADITALSGLTGLKTLSADNCSITTLEPLTGLTELTTLSVNENRLKNLVGLEGAVSLNCIWANKNEITSLRALTNLPALTELHVEYNQLPSLIAMKNSTSIKQIYAFGNRLTETVDFPDGVTVYTGT